MVNTIDLFCGAGGFGLAAERCGFDTVGYDINEDAVATYNRNCGDAYVHDLTEEIPHTYDDIQLVCGGFPCQPFSSANNHKSRLDERRTLGDRFIDHVERFDPDTVIIENVSALKRRHESYFNHVRSRLSDAGYMTTHAILNAAEYGVAQTRKRLFMIGQKRITPAVPSPTHEEYLGTGDVLSLPPHEHKSGGRTSGSAWRDETTPSHTITAQHNNVVRVDGDEWRWWDTDETQQIQSFPESYEFVGTQTSVGRQIGNAVPPQLAEAIINVNTV